VRAAPPLAVVVFGGSLANSFVAVIAAAHFRMITGGEARGTAHLRGGIAFQGPTAVAAKSSVFTGLLLRDTAASIFAGTGAAFRAGVAPTLTIWPAAVIASATL